MRVLVSCALVLSCCTSLVWAADGEEAAEAIDLNAAWAAQDGGTASNFTISASGSYYLSDDLSVSAILLVAAKGCAVDLALNGHTLTCTETSMGCAIRVTAAGSFTLDGGGGSLVYAGSIPRNVVYSAGSALSISDLSLYASPNSANTSIANLACYGIYATTGAVSLSGCEVVLDLSNQTKASTVNTSTSFKGSPAGVYFESAVSSATLDECTVRVTNSRYAARSDVSESTLGYAYAVKSVAKGEVVVRGGSFAVQSVLGQAVALKLRYARLENSSAGAVAACADGGIASYAVQATAAGGTTLAGALEFEFGGLTEPDVSAALYSTVENAFVFESGFSATAASVLVGEDDAACGDGVVVGAFASGTTAAQQASIAAMCVNALGSEAACDLKVSSGSLVFALDATRAVAQVVSGSTATAYSSVNAALAAAGSGATVQLLANSSTATFTKTSGAYTLDLNGYTLASLTCSGAGSLTVCSSRAGGAIVGPASRSESTVVAITAAGTYNFDGIEISANSSSTSVNAISVTAACTLNLTDVALAACAMTGPVRAIYATAAAKISAKGGSICATTEAASATVCAIYASSASATLALSNCELTASSVKGNVGGIDAAGSVTLSGVALQVSTRKAASWAWGVRLASGSTTAAGTLSDTSIVVSAGADSTNKEYWCLAAGDSGNNSAVQWSLAGSIAFESANSPAVGVCRLPGQVAADVEVAAAVTLACASLTDRVAVVGASDANICSHTSSFVAAPGSEFEGWQLAANEAGTQLAFTRSLSVLNGATNLAYATIADAIQAADDSATLILQGDIALASGETWELGGRSLTINFNGHALSYAAGSAANAGSSGEGAALVINGAGTLTLKDETREGSLSATVGSVAETSSSTTYPYQGISVNGGAKLQVSGLKLSVSYVGSTTAEVSAGLRGICVNSGEVSLTSGATLQVSACAEESGEGRGAIEATALWLAEAANATVSADSSVNISNTSAPTEHTASNLIYPEYNGWSQIAMQAVELRRVYLVEGDGLYERVQAKFLATAKYDSGTQIYYAGQMMLDDGTYVWAYSEPVAEEDVGRLASIVASYVFMQTQYEDVPCAQAVAGGGEGSVVQVAGQLQASCTNGDAYGVNAAAGTWDLSGASITAAAGEGSNLVRGSYADLRDFIDFPTTQTSSVFYPSGDSAILVTETDACARAVLAASGVALTTTAATQLSATGADCDDVEADWALEAGEGLDWQADGCVYFYAAGKLIQKVSGLSAGDEVALPSEAKVRRKAAFSYTYTFLGWSASNATTTLDESAGDLLAGTTSFTFEEATTLHAIYAKLPANIALTCTNMRDAAGNALDDVTLQVPYLSSLDAEGITLPAAADYEINGVAFRFVGWAPDSSYTYSAATAQALTFDATLTGVSSGACTFTAVYVPVAAGQHLITFNVDGNLTAYAEEDGATPRYGKATEPNGDNVPTGSGSFMGWAVGLDAGSVYAEGDDTILGSLPAATEDAAYTARFLVASSTSSGTLTLCYWRTLSNGEDSYSSVSVSLAGTSATEAAAALVQVGDEYIIGTQVYTFIGWGYRSSDVEPAYTTELPSGSGTYYGIYELSERSVTVEFWVAGELYATAEGLSLKQTIDAAFLETGAETPTTEEEGYSFQGWAYTASAATALRGSLITLSTALTASGASGNTLVLHALFGLTYRPYVGFYYALEESPLASTEATAGQTVAELGIEPAAQSLLGHYFAGWQTAEGAYFSLDSVIEDDLYLYARFLALEALTCDDGAEVDFSAAGIAQRGMDFAEEVGFTLSTCEGVDEAVAERLATDGYECASSFTFNLGYTLEGERTFVTTGFGSVKLTLPVEDGTKVKIYWLRADGSVGASSVKTAEDGVVSVPLADYGVSEAANLVVATEAAEPASSTTDSAATKTTTKTKAKSKKLSSLTALTSLKAAGLATTALKATKKSAKAKKKKAAAAIEEAVEKLTAANSLAETLTLDDEDATEDTGRDLNTLIFYLLAAFALAALLACVRWFINFAPAGQTEADSAPANSEEIRF